MAGSSDLPGGFTALDGLLDQALALEGVQRREFLEGLPADSRAALIALLEHSAANPLIGVAEAARAAVAQTAAPDGVAAAAAQAGQWQLQREIGSGGTGQVFYAERNSPESTGYRQRAAVKILWSHRVASEFQQRFYRERRIVASFDHPGLARFLDGGLLADGRPWFAMEYVDGTDVLSYCAALRIPARLDLFLDICETLEFAHQRLIVHRDIKPQNVLVDTSGRPRVLDFGVASMLGDGDQEALTRTGGTPLTLQYASPEQVTGEVVHVASDVYQLGLLLHEMLTGRPACDLTGQSLQEAIHSICEVTAPPPSHSNPAVDRDLDAVLGRALHKQPGQRYPSAAALAEDVRRHREGRPVAARGRSPAYVAGRFVRRHALLVGVAASTALTLAGATVFSLNMADEARAEAERSRITREVLADVFRQADPFGSGGRDVSLADALLRAEPDIAARVAGDPRLAWEVNRTLAGIFASLDLLDAERSAYEAAWAATREMADAHQAQALFAVAGIGNTLARTDPDAALAFLAEHLPETPDDTEAAEHWLAGRYAEISALTRLRRFEAADRRALETAAVARRFGVDAPRTMGRISQLLAGAARRAGDIPGADRHWADAVAYMQRADVPAGHAVTLANMALHYGMTGRYAESEAAFQQALAVFREYAPEDAAHADVLRSYAGLQFRVAEPVKALASLDAALRILDPATQGYPYFVAQLSRARFAFATADPATTFAAIDAGLQVAIDQFGADSEVTARMRPVFARLLLLAELPLEAGLALGLGEAALCDTVENRLAAIEDSLRAADEAPDLVAARAALNAAIDRAGTPDGPVPAAVDDLLAGYRNSTHVFLDALDQRRFFAALARIAPTGHPLPTDLVRDRRGSAETVDAARALVAARATRIGELLAGLNPGVTAPIAAACSR